VRVQSSSHYGDNLDISSITEFFWFLIQPLDNAALSYRFLGLEPRSAIISTEEYLGMPSPLSPLMTVLYRLCRRQRFIYELFQYGRKLFQHQETFAVGQSLYHLIELINLLGCRILLHIVLPIMSSASTSTERILLCRVAPSIHHESLPRQLNIEFQS
jgi:hypothetical protein